MIKQIVLLMLMLASVCFGVYDGSAVPTLYGTGFTGAYGTLTTANETNANPDLTIVKSGTLTRFQARMYSVDSDPTALVKLKVFTNATTMRTELDITAGVNADKPGSTGAFNCEITGLSLAVNAGEFIGIYTDADIRMGTSNATGPQRDLYEGAGDATSLTDNGLNQDLVMEFDIDVTDRIMFDDNNSDAGFGNGDEVFLPTYTEDGYYIVLEGVQVPNGESLAIVFNYYATTNSYTTAETYTINMTADTITDSDATSKSLAGQDGVGEKIDYHFYFNLTTGEKDVIYANYTNGQGDQGDKDIVHVSLNDRIPAAETLKIRTVSFTNVGTNALVDRIIVCREPVVVIGDSFTSQYDAGVTSLGLVGAKLDDVGVFSKQRYVINGGVTGNSVTFDSAGNVTSIRHRWDSGGNDLCSYRDVVYCFVNGPGINDIASFISDTNTDAELLGRPYQIAGDILKMIGDTQFDFIAATGDSETTDVIMCELMPYTTGSGQTLVNKQLVITRLNEALKFGSNKTQVPLALIHDGYVAAGGGTPDGTHPDTAGITWIASQIVTAYENNIVPSLATGAGRRGRYNQ